MRVTKFRGEIILKILFSFRLEEHDMVFKLIRLAEEDRAYSNINDQFQNENLIYEKFVPYCNELLKKANAKFSMDDLVPHTYYAKFDYVPGMYNR